MYSLFVFRCTSLLSHAQHTLSWSTTAVVVVRVLLRCGYTDPEDHDQIHDMSVSLESWSFGWFRLLIVCTLNSYDLDSVASATAWAPASCLPWVARSPHIVSALVFAYSCIEGEFFLLFFCTSPPPTAKMRVRCINAVGVITFCSCGKLTMSRVCHGALASTGCPAPLHQRGYFI